MLLGVSMKKSVIGSVSESLVFIPAIIKLPSSAASVIVMVRVPAPVGIAVVPSLFAPSKELANRTLANSLPGPFALWPFLTPWISCSLELSLLGFFAPKNENSELSLLKLSLPSTSKV